MPDGKTLLLTLSNGGNPDLYKMTVDGRSLTKLTNGRSGDLNVEPTASYDGTKIAFSSNSSLVFRNTSCWLFSSLASDCDCTNSSSVLEFDSIVFNTIPILSVNPSRKSKWV